MRIIALYNIKGGVGKTASAVNLAALAARGGARTLLWDIDPQGAASFYLRVRAQGKGDRQWLLKHKDKLAQVVCETEHAGLDLIPADFSYRNLDLSLAEAKKPAKQLLKLMRPLADHYDYLFLDCPPSISLVSENVFMAADALAVPMLPTVLSERTLGQLEGFLGEHDHRHLPVYPFFTMVDRRKRLHLDVIERLQAERPTQLLDAHIPYNSLVEQMGVQRAPLADYAPRSPAALAYEALWEGLRGRL